MLDERIKVFVAVKQHETALHAGEWQLRCRWSWTLVFLTTLANVDKRSNSRLKTDFLIEESR